jgi:hypothetical protein
MQKPITDDASYNFSDYFRLVDYPDEILTHFGYEFVRQKYTLPCSARKLERLAEFVQPWEEGLLYINLTNETAKREFLIAPVLLTVARYTHANVKIEFPLNVNKQLKGVVDYYLRSRANLLVIEAKNSDLERGFIQLAVELVAFDKWTTEDFPLLYGAVSTGQVWQFGILDRQRKLVIQDFNLYRVPADLESLLRSLIGILGEGGEE